MSCAVNKFYGILVDGDAGTVDNRQSTIKRDSLSKEVLRIVEALVPPGLDKNTRRALAELYLRLIYTDKSLIAALKTYDPVNSYTLHTFYQTYDGGFDLDKIVKGIKSLGLEGEEVSFLPLDYIMNALRQLLSVLNGN